MNIYSRKIAQDLSYKSALYVPLEFVLETEIFLCFYRKNSETDNGYNLVRTSSFGNLLRDAYDLMPDRDVSSSNEDEESESGDSVLAQGR